MSPVVHVKICGVTTAADAVASVALGASAIGVNFVPASPRHVDVATARAIARAVHAAPSRAPDGTRVIVVGVVADLSLEAMQTLLREAEVDCLQLHGSESDGVLAALLPHAYKAVRIATAEDAAQARSVPGEYLLVDAKVDGALGGTGTTFDWSLVAELARTRRLTLAGGLHPGNVERAVRTLHPYCVDVASGVESAPGVKDAALVAAFIEAARRGAASPE
ncbi:phosphoribosylanthranilate isomerase [soil metagenome]